MIFEKGGGEFQSSTLHLPAWVPTLAFSSETAMGRRPISFGQINTRVDTLERRNLILALFTEREASHLRARCARCDQSSDASWPRPLLLHPQLHHHPHQLAWCQSRLPAAALSELGPRLENAIVKYVDVCSILCVAVQKFSACGGHAENSIRCQHAAWISVVRGSTRRPFALLQGSVL